MKRSLTLFLNDIKESIEKIESYLKGFSFDDFVNDPKTIDAVVRNLEIIGEAAKNIPPDFRSTHSTIEWTEMIGMRNKITHDYFGIDYQVVWETATNDLPPLKAHIILLLENKNIY